MYLLDFFSTTFSDLIEEPVLIVGLIVIFCSVFLINIAQL